MGFFSDLSHKFQDWRDDMKGTFVFDAAKSIGRTGADVLQYGSVPFGALFGGPLGALVSMPIAAAAGQVGPNENRSSQLRRDLVSGAAVTAGTTAFSLITGGGFGNSLIQSFNSLFGFGASPPPQSATPGKPMSDADLYKQYFPPPKPSAGAGGNGGFDPLKALGTIFNPNAQANTASLQQQYADQLKLAEQYRKAGDVAGAAQAAALAEMYRSQLAAQGVAPSGGGFPLGLVLLVGVAAWFLLRKK